MTVYFDHHIVPSTDKHRTADFLADLLGLPTPREEGPFAAVDLGNDVSLYVAGWETEVVPQHYAFSVTEGEFDAAYARILARGLTHWADPFCERPGEVNTDDGGRGTYLRGPDGHFLEIITVRYGGRPRTVVPR